MHLTVNMLESIVSIRMQYKYMFLPMHVSDTDDSLFTIDCDNGA